VDTAAAKARPGVHAVITAEELGDYWQPGPLLVPPPPDRGHGLPPSAARCRSRRGGPPPRASQVALVIAESRYIAEDAVGDIEVEYEPLARVGDLGAALAPGAGAVA
jgi:CO/xanthine dehydrogenase Mo-binding subunit